MSKAHSDPRTNAQKVTNADDQDVVVNHSTVQEGGYDEPVNQQEEAQPVEKQPKKEEKTAEQPRPTDKPQPGAARKRPYDEEEAE